VVFERGKKTEIEAMTTNLFCSILWRDKFKSRFRSFAGFIFVDVLTELATLLPDIMNPETPSATQSTSWKPPMPGL
jgi:hypothetical protein